MTATAFLTGIYNWCAQALAAAPLALQVAVVLIIAVPLAAVAAIVVLRGVDFCGLWLQRVLEGGSRDAGE